jgi:hypothetical protein
MNIAVTRRCTAIVEERYTLDYDDEEYKKFKEENPDAEIVDFVHAAEAKDRFDYECDVEDTIAEHDIEYEEA